MRRIVVALCVCFIVMPFTSCNSNVNQEPMQEPQETTQSEEKVTTALPNMSEIKVAETPLLYDFVFGCLDWHVPLGRDIIDSDLYIMRNVRAPGVLYTDWYPIQAGFSVPPLGSVIETVTLSERDTDNFSTVVAELPSQYVLHEGDWELIIYAEDAARALLDAGFSFRNAYKYTESRLPPFLAIGHGWPSEWLRREPYATALKGAGIDINDVWWDLFNYRGEYKLTTDEGFMTPEGYYVICTGIREFSLCDGQGNVSRGMTWENVMGTCNALECNIGEIYKYGAWEPSIKE